MEKKIHPFRPNHGPQSLAASCSGIFHVQVVDYVLRTCDQTYQPLIESKHFLSVLHWFGVSSIWYNGCWDNRGAPTSGIGRCMGYSFYPDRLTVSGSIGNRTPHLGTSTVQRPFSVSESPRGATLGLLDQHACWRHAGWTWSPNGSCMGNFVEEECLLKLIYRVLEMSSAGTELLFCSSWLRYCQQW